MILEKYQDRKKEYRWRIKSPNGRIMADSGEGYSTKGALTQALNVLFEWVFNDTMRKRVVDLTKK